MRTLVGDVVLPSSCPVTRAASVRVEVRDVSRADAPSSVVAETVLTNVEIKPFSRIAFSLEVPSYPRARSLDVRVHVSLQGRGMVQHGDLLSTASHPIATEGPLGHMAVPVTLV
jgi:uncharacterized lipoprotein YbaY